MKTKNFKYILAAGLVCCGLTTTFSSCGDVLDEQPRSQFDPTYFNTKAGIVGDRYRRVYLCAVCRR